ncbi:relaxase/mobilization nuclease domain-containing protein [Brevundimonas naejangsanensis]|uniref:relaxase/mobilization nuclease domain-containing protein n=1 Tax=Brevundimonas naejangsanensis TaxID=588932 RepID=UPI0026EA51A3|nr:relaxase/mobilization nuclease domain-containing protein [Brevundimonas naejangsanensis]
MSDFRRPLGFEEALRPPIDVRRARITQAVLRPSGRAGDAAAYAQLARVVRRVPEVMVKITGKTKDARHLRRHLDYISRNGRLVLEGPDGERHQGREAVADLTAAWAAEQALEPGRRRDSSLSRSIVLSMPAGTDPQRLHDAARAFARATFGERFPYVFALHDEDRHPHVHLTVRVLGADGSRLNPRKADLEQWRQTFAQVLRDRGVEAEASPRRARGVVRKAERTPVRKLRERFVDGKGAAPRVLAGAVREAIDGRDKDAPWQTAIRDRQARIRRALVAEAVALSRSDRAEDRVLGVALKAHVQTLPKMETRGQRLARLETARSERDDRTDR